jgi:hypothetical protein
MVMAASTKFCLHEENKILSTQNEEWISAGLRIISRITVPVYVSIHHVQHKYGLPTIRK